MTSRELVLERVRRNQPRVMPLPEVPDFARPLASPMVSFGAALARMGGSVAELPERTSLDAFIRERFPNAHVVCSAVPEAEGTRRIAPADPPASLADVDVGIVRAAFGVAETGSVWLSETEFGVNALGFLSQHLVVLLDPGAIVPFFGNMPNILALAVEQISTHLFRLNPRSITPP